MCAYTHVYILYAQIFPEHLEVSYTHCDLYLNTSVFSKNRDFFHITIAQSTFTGTVTSQPCLSCCLSVISPSEYVSKGRHCTQSSWLFSSCDLENFLCLVFQGLLRGPWGRGGLTRSDVDACHGIGSPRCPCIFPSLQLL